MCEVNLGFIQGKLCVLTRGFKVLSSASSGTLLQLRKHNQELEQSVMVSKTQVFEFQYCYIYSNYEGPLQDDSFVQFLKNIFKRKVMSSNLILVAVFLNLKINLKQSRLRNVLLVYNFTADNYFYLNSTRSKKQESPNQRKNHNS